MSTTIRISDETKARIDKLAADTGRRLTDVVEQAVDTLERRVFFDAVNRRYAELRADPESWAEIEAERALEENALRDGLE